MSNMSHKSRNTLFLLLFLVIVCAASWLILRITDGRILPGPGGPSAEVSVDSHVTGTYPLSEDLDVTIDGWQGGTNRLIIKDGEAFVREADCPDKICVKQGHIKNPGEVIVCMPHRVVVTIK